VLLCSDSEGSPMIIKEAMACNKCIVSTNVGDVSNRISQIQHTYIVEQNPIAIADKLVEIYPYRDSLSNGRDILIHQRLDNQAVIENLVEIYGDHQ